MEIIPLTIYIIGCLFGYIFIASITQNVYGGIKNIRATKFLIYSTILIYTVGSWFTVTLFGVISIMDSSFRKYMLFPLHIKINLDK